MKKYFILLMVLTCHLGFAQKIVSNKSSTKFFSSAMLEDITAITTKGKSVINTSNGNIAFAIPIKSFEFAKSLMQEHFNEKYMETERFPKASFSGAIKEWSGQTNSEATAHGKLTIHGVTKQITARGKVDFLKKKLVITAKFNLRLEDYGVEVPSLMFQKIAEVVEVTITYEYPFDEK